MPTDPTTVLIADARVLVRNGVKTLIASLLGDVSFVEVDDGDALLRPVEWATVRFALVDPGMPRMDGGRRLIEFAQRYPSIPLVVISAVSSPDILRRVASIPTLCAFVPVSASMDSIQLALEAAMQGRKLPMKQTVAASVPLTPRQEEVRRLLRAGMSNKSIAGALGISESTVKNHISDIFRALKATNRTQAARLDATE